MKKKKDIKNPKLINKAFQDVDIITVSKVKIPIEISNNIFNIP